MECATLLRIVKWHNGRFNPEYGPPCSIGKDKLLFGLECAIAVTFSSGRGTAIAIWSCFVAFYSPYWFD